MGGNLFKVGRISKLEYDKILLELIPILNKHFGEYYRIPVAYRSKKDYGDVDIILDAGFILNKNDWKEKLVADLGVTQTQSIRNVFSMLYNNFQVDIFLVKTKQLETTYNFMSYNILGNLIGRLYHKFNLRYGQDGLFYVLRGYSNHISKEIIISRDMREMLAFVDLSYDRWLRGFDNLEEIFEYVMSSKYFCSNSYDLKYYTIEKRAEERPDFLAFLNYINDNKIEKNFPFNKEKEIYLDQIDEFFKTDLRIQFENHLKKIESEKLVREKFNGHIFMEILPIRNNELGAFINKYKGAYGENFDNFILATDIEKIKEDILLKYRLTL